MHCILKIMSLVKEGVQATQSFKAAKNSVEAEESVVPNAEDVLGNVALLR